MDLIVAVIRAMLRGEAVTQAVVRIERLVVIAAALAFIATQLFLVAIILFALAVDQALLPRLGEAWAALATGAGVLILALAAGGAAAFTMRRRPVRRANDSLEQLMPIATRTIEELTRLLDRLKDEDLGKVGMFALLGGILLGLFLRRS